LGKDISYDSSIELDFLSVMLLTEKTQLYKINMFFCETGKYAMRDLVQKLPSGNPQHDHGTSDDTIAAVLVTVLQNFVSSLPTTRLNKLGCLSRRACSIGEPRKVDKR
jgi:hypothetical protein